MAAKQSKESDQTFETAINRLEQIVEEMESDKLPLEQLLVRYEEGTRLAKVCQEKLDSAEKRIEIIARGASGKPQLVEFEGAEEVVSSPESSGEAAASTTKPAARPPKPDADEEEVTLF